MRRRSFTHFLAFKCVLNKTKQDAVFQIFDKLNSSVMNIHCKISIESPIGDVAGVESNICESLNNPHQSSEAEQRDVTEQFKRLTENRVKFVGASPTGSIVVYFLCETFDALIYFKKSYDSGELQRILESVFNCIAARSAIHLTVEVNLEETIYKQSINEARETMYYDDIEKKTIYPGIMLLPAEMTQLILKKALILCWSAGLRNTHMKTSKSKALFTEFIRDGDKSACINLKSVSHKWMDCGLKSLARQGCFLKQQLLDAGQTVTDSEQCESNILNQQTDESLRHYYSKTSQERVQENSFLDISTPKVFAIGSNTSQNLFTIDACKANMAEFSNKIHNFKQKYHNERTTKCYQLKIHRKADDDVEEVVRKFYELELKTALSLDRIKLIKHQWRTLDLCEIVQRVNSRSTMKFDREELIKQDETSAVYEADEILRRLVVLCCWFEDVMTDLGWKVGVTLDIEEDVCDVVGKLMMEVAEQDRTSILNCMHHAITSIQVQESEIKLNSDKLRTLLMKKNKYNGLNLACILLEQMILDNKDNNVSWMRTVCTQFIDLVVQLIIEPEYRKDVLSILYHLMKLGSLWSVADIYTLMRNGIIMFQYRQDYFIRYLTMIRNFAVDPSMIVCQHNNKAGLCLKSILYCRDKSTLGSLNSETYDVGFEKCLDQILSELSEAEIVQEELRLLRLILDKFFVILGNTEEFEHGIEVELYRIENSEEIDVDLLSSCLAVTSMALYMSMEFLPSYPQLVSYCLLLARNRRDKGRLLEISTGEGKSCVVAMVAATYALLGRTVDIVTSSPVLSQRDADKWQTFYTKLYLSAACNVGEITEGDTGVYDCHIVYGTVETFARDILKTEFLLQDVCKGRESDIVIVDEVDSMLIDQGVQCTYLSHDMASIGMSHFEPILTLIWMHVSRFISIHGKDDNVFHGTEPELFIATLSRLSNGNDPLKILRLAENDALVQKEFTDDYLCEDLKEQDRLLHSLKERVRKRVFEFAVEYLNLDIAINYAFEIPDRTSILVFVGGLSSVAISDDVMKERLTEMIIDALSEESDHKIILPVYLREYCITRLGHWINNAFVAKQMTYGREYIVENNAIYPVDYTSTGVIETNKKWGDGLQQFLEMKHGLPMSPLSLITNFLSNIDYFQRYGSNILGVSGTLGNAAERKFMDDTFSVEFATIPTYERSKLFELDGVILGDKDQWQNAILEQVESTIENERAVLIICEDIATANDMHEFIASANNIIKIHMYTKNTCNDEYFEKNELKPSNLLITTNLGARGSDFVIDDILYKNGGLFVLVTFIPLNDRVEKQAFGRTGRGGATGSCQIIVNRETMPEWLRECGTVNEAKRLRDSIETHRLHKTDEVDMMHNKQALFREYCELKKRFVTSSNCDSDDLIIQVELLDETWAKWMQEYGARVQRSNLDEMVQDLREIIEECSKRAKHFDSDNIYHLMKFGGVRQTTGDFEGATKFYNQVIRMDSSWSAFAHYNRAYCTIQMKGDGYIRRAIDDLKATLCKLEINKHNLLLSESFNMKKKSWKSNVRDDPTFERWNSRLAKYCTMMECQLLHHIDTQIIETIEKLETTDTNNEEVKTECRNILDLIPNVDSMIVQLLDRYRQFGLLFTFNINEKPKFCYEAKIMSSLVLLGAVSDILLRLKFQGISLNANSQFESEDVSELICNLEAVNDDSLAWMSRCVVATVTTGLRSIAFMRDVSSLLAFRQPIGGSTSETNLETSEFSQFSRNQARHVFTLLATATNNTKKFMGLIEDELILHITDVVMNGVAEKLDKAFQNQLKTGQELHRESCMLYGSVTSHSNPNCEQFVDFIQDLTMVLGSAYSSQPCDDYFHTIMLNNFAADLLVKCLDGSITATDMCSLITGFCTVIVAETDIILAISKITDLLADNMNALIQNPPEVGYPNDDGQMLEATTKDLTSVCSDIIRSAVQRRITLALMFDPREDTMRSYSLLYEQLLNANERIMGGYMPSFTSTSRCKYLNIVSACSSDFWTEIRDLLTRSKIETNAKYSNLNLIIMDVDKEEIITFLRPENHETIQLVYNPPCCEFPGGHYDAYKDGKVVKVPREKKCGFFYEDEEEDDKLWCSAIATAKGHASFIIMEHYIKDYIIEHPRRFGELFISEQYASQLKCIRALYRLNTNHPTTQSEHVPLDSSQLISCILQALKTENVSRLASVLAKCESESKSAEESSSGRKTEAMTSQLSRDACDIFLSSGSSVEAEVYRQLVAERINDGDITTALQLCCIGHQMVFDRNIRDAISSTSDPQVLEDTLERMNKWNLYRGERAKYLSTCDEWYKVLEPHGLMNIEQKELLRKWIIERQYANIEDSVVSLMIEKCSVAKKEEKKRKKEQAVQQKRKRKQEANQRREKIQNKDLI